MTIHSLKLKSKINLLNATVAQYHDSGLFTPIEIAELSAPVLAQINDANNLRTEADIRDIEVIDAEIITPQSPLH